MADIEIGNAEMKNVEIEKAEAANAETIGSKPAKATKTKIKSMLPYAGLPLIMAAMLFLHAARTDPFVLLICELAIAFGYAAAVLDIKAKSIPNSLVLAMLVAWALTMAPKLFLDTDAAVMFLRDAALGFLVGGGLFLFIYIISRKGLGGGDVKFMAAAGLYIGFSGTLSAMLYGTVLAAVAGLALLLSKKLTRKDAMPLAPFLYVGILITVFYR